MMPAGTAAPALAATQVLMRQSRVWGAGCRVHYCLGPTVLLLCMPCTQKSTTLHPTMQHCASPQHIGSMVLSAHSYLTPFHAGGLETLDETPSGELADASPRTATGASRQNSIDAPRRPLSIAEQSHHKVPLHS
jgi:hypothetical protein